MSAALIVDCRSSRLLRESALSAVTCEKYLGLRENVSNSYRSDVPCRPGA
jgi:hypothetical protein